MNLDPVEANAQSAEMIAALTDAALKRLGGSTVFQRDQTYASSGAVQVISEELGSTPTIHATVYGTEPYSTEVWIDEDSVGGSCDCTDLCLSLSRHAQHNNQGEDKSCRW